MAQDKSKITVGFPLYQDCTLLDFAGATQMFSPFAGAGFTPIWLAETMEPIETTEQVSVIPHQTLAETEAVDILFIPGGGPDGVTQMMNDPCFLGHIDRLAETAKWAGSVCTGAFIFAATGRFAGLTATTYWSQLENLALFPGVNVPRDDYPPGILNHEAGVFSGGGVSSSIDLALELIKTIRGIEVCQTADLANQYAPNPPVISGNPAEAPAPITAKLREDQDSFIAQMRGATEKAVSKL